MMLAEQFDHLVLTVGDIEATCAFYGGILGMKVIEFAGGRKALQFGTQKVNLHRAGAEIEPHARRPTPGSADICLLTSLPMEQVVSRLNDRGWISSTGRCSAPEQPGRFCRFTSGTRTAT